MPAALLELPKAPGALVLPARTRAPDAVERERDRRIGERELEWKRVFGIASSHLQAIRELQVPAPAAPPAR